MIATVSLDCKNLFSYAENNPVMAKDSSGGVVETVFDVITIGISVVDVCCNPTDPWAWVGLAGDCVDLIPFVTGVGEGVKGLRLLAKAADKTADVADTIHDSTKVADKFSDVAKLTKKSGAEASEFFQDVNGRWHRANGQFASNAEVGISSPAKTPKGSHGNSLSDPRTNYGYALVDKDTNEILKFGETIHPKTRYSKKYLDANNADMMILEQGSKEYIHYWQYDMNKYYQYMYEEFPPLLNSKGW